jgi:ubiquinone/menaquinone biosynthesis C-methylase UbiE
MLNNFDKRLINEYDELMKAWPHADEFRRIGVVAIKNYLSQKPKDHYSVFEIGTGRGELTRLVLESDDRLRVVAAEMDASMFIDAQKNLVKYFNRCLLLNTDGVAFAGLLNNIDIFMSCWTLHNLRADTKPFLSEIYRLLSPGGFFLNLDKYVPNGPKSDGMIDAHFEKLKILSPGIREIATRHEKEDLNPEYMQTESDLELMRKIGFRNINAGPRFGLDMIVTAYK